MTDEIRGETVSSAQPNQCIEMQSCPDQAETGSIISTLSDVPSDIIITSRINYGNFWSACKGLWLDYSKNSNIHGLPYIFKIHSSIYEKLFWAFVWLVSLYFAISLIMESYIKWRDTPVILGFDETLVPIEDIPFPTITICPQIKSDKFSFEYVSDFLENEKFDNLTMEEQINFTAMLQLCDPEVIEHFASFVPKELRPDVVKTLIEISTWLEYSTSSCKWNTRLYDCKSIMRLVVTDEGICYQFNGMEIKDIYRDPNYVNYSDDKVDFSNTMDNEGPPLDNITGSWSLEGGFINQGYNSYPQRMISAALRSAFRIVMDSLTKNFEYSCRNFETQGYKVFFNSPETAVSTLTGNYILVPHGYELMLIVQPHYIISDTSLRDISPAKRQCYFNDERYLRFFRSYSQTNCQTECLTNFTIAKCACAKFWMPKPKDVPTCSLFDTDCYTNAEIELNLIIQNETIERGVNPQQEITCNCMPSCTSLDYNVEISQAVYDVIKLHESYRLPLENDLSDAKTSLLEVYFKEQQFTAIKRTILYSLTTLIANFGGILGLFVGVSSLSVVELIYFFTLRLAANLRQRRQAKRKLEKSEQSHQE